METYKGRDLPIRVLSLGAGVQSTVVLLMSIFGELPPLDCAIFADTQWEPRAVYEHLEWLKKIAFEHSLPIHIVSAGSIRESLLKSVKLSGGRFVVAPMFTFHNGKKGVLRRQCTREVKIQPLTNFVRREVLGVAFNKWAPRQILIERWMGISTDEIMRAKESRDKFSINKYPLIEKNMNRQDCIDWFEKKFPGRKLPRSACIGCPYHSDKEWLSLTKEEFADAVEIDKAIRVREGMIGESFLHRSRQPLDKVDFKGNEKPVDNWNNECEGMCGV